MPFGEIFIGTFSQIWRHKRLWLFGLLGVALTSIGGGIYQFFQFRWQSQFVDMLGGARANPSAVPARFFGDMMSAMTWLWAGFGIWMLVSLLGYVINLIMRVATMNEATFAWGGGRPETGRGLSAGVGRGIYVFLIDLLWLLPGILLGCGSLGAFAAIIAADAASNGGNEAGVVTILAALCCLFCLALVVGLLYAVFAPLMYQSAVAGRRGLGAAISEGWRLGQANLGAMIIFAVFLWILTIVVMMAVSVLSMPFALPWLSGYMRDMTGVMEDARHGLTPTMPSFRSGWLLLAFLVSSFLTWLATGFLQSFRLTLYAGVYRHLGGRDELVEPEPPSSVGGAAPAPPLVAAPLEGETGDASPGELAEITVPDEAAGPIEPPVEVTGPHV